MKLTVYKPQNKVLEEIIDCFYILRRTREEPDSSYITFPSVFTIVSVSPQSTLIWEKQTALIVKDKTTRLNSTLVSRFKKPISVKYTCEIIEMTIYFKPLGLNTLLDKNLNDFKDGSLFFPFPDYEESILEIFKIKNDLRKIKCLEAYLISKHKGFSDRFLPSFVKDLSDENYFQTSISDLALKYKISMKNLVKNFERHTCKTPLQFRKIVRFRAAMKKYNDQPGSLSLTELTHILHYFDQSHLIKDFKALTGYPPKVFFKKLSLMEHGKVNWIFL